MATYYNPVLIFQSANPSVVSLEFANGETNPPTRIDFVEGTSSDTQQTVLTAAVAFDWVPLPPTNTNGFVTAIENDATLANVLALLMPFYAAIESYESDPQAIKTAWAQLKAQYSSELTSDIVTTVEGYAIINNMPLT
jgi:hypothetical protein